MTKIKGNILFQTLGYQQVKMPCVIETDKNIGGEQGPLGKKGDKGDKGDPLTYNDLTEALKAEIAQPATAQAAIAVQQLEAIHTSIDNLDPSQSTSDAIVAEAATRASKDAELEADLTALGPKCDQNEADIAALQEEVVEVGARAGSYDHIPLLGGQPMMLFGSGAPVEANVPDNWIGFDDGGFEWIGTPSMMGQQYIDTTNGEKYVSVKNGFTLSWLNV